MKKRIFFGFIIVSALALSLLAHSKSGTAQAENTRLVTVHVDGVSHTVATNADTVQGVLNQLGTTVNSHDKTEPDLKSSVKGANFTVNVYRAQPITVVDGANSYTVVTAERSPKAIAKEAGFKTSQEDQFAYQRSDEVTASVPTTQMLIKRAKNIVLDLYGTTTNLKTNETTVADLLKARGLNLDESDELNVPQAARISEGMKVSIARVDKNLKTVEEAVPFAEQKIQDVNQPVTYRQLKTAGKNGKKLVTYELTLRNGQPAHKKSVKEVITIRPVTQVVVVGARPFNSNVSADKQSIMAAAGIAAVDYDYVDYIVTRESGWRVNASNGATWGLCQALPGSKMSSAGADWQTNPVTQLKWCSGYAAGRYGSWAGAYAAWLRQNWW